jgi:hypothetical protein
MAIICHCYPAFSFPYACAIVLNVTVTLTVVLNTYLLIPYIYIMKQKNATFFFALRIFVTC